MKSFLILLTLLLGAEALGHEIRPAFLEVVELKNPGIYEASFRQPQIAGRFLGLSVATNCEQVNLSSRITDSALTEVFELNCGRENLQEIEVVGLDRTMIDTLVSINWLDSREDKTADFLITGDEPKLDLMAEVKRLPVYLVIGLAHILQGYDHILFLLMLMYLVRQPIGILKVITSFTIAHSITLGLSVFKIINLSQGPIEAIIAGSIILLAYENLRVARPQNINYSVFIAFSFGLLHGLGFAGALVEIGLPESNRLTALFLFNVGIEIGQLGVIALILVSLSIVREKFSRLFSKVPIYACGSIASFWFIDRSWLIISPLFS